MLQSLFWEIRNTLYKKNKHKTQKAVLQSVKPGGHKFVTVTTLSSPALPPPVGAHDAGPPCHRSPRARVGSP